MIRATIMMSRQAHSPGTMILFMTFRAAGPFHVMKPMISAAMIVQKMMPPPESVCPVRAVIRLFDERAHMDDSMIAHPTFRKMKMPNTIFMPIFPKKIPIAVYESIPYLCAMIDTAIATNSVPIRLPASAVISASLKFRIPASSPPVRKHHVATPYPVLANSESPIPYILSSLSKGMELNFASLA